MNNSEIKELLAIMKLQNELAANYFNHLRAGKQDIISADPQRNEVADLRRRDSIGEMIAKREHLDHLIAKLEASLG